MLWCLFFIFWPLLAGKWALLLCAPLMVWSLQTRPKCWLTGWAFGPTARYLESMFSKFPGLNCKLLEILNLNTKNSSPSPFFEIMAYKLVVTFFGPILRNQLFRIIEFRLFSELSAILDSGHLWISVTVEKIHNQQFWKKKRNSKIRTSLLLRFDPKNITTKLL